MRVVQPGLNSGRPSPGSETITGSAWSRPAKVDDARLTPSRSHTRPRPRRDRRHRPPPRPGPRKALADLDAVDVDLDGQTGYVLPGDLEPTAPVEPWTALLPPVDPTTMGWIEREWYLGPYESQLFDTSGNAGPTA